MPISPLLRYAAAPAALFCAMPAHAQLISIDIDARLLDLDTRVTLQGERITVIDGQVADQAALLRALGANVTAIDTVVRGNVQAVAAVRADLDAQVQLTAQASAGIAANGEALVRIDADLARQAGAIGTVETGLGAAVLRLDTQDRRLGEHDGALARIDADIGVLNGGVARLAADVDGLRGDGAALATIVAGQGRRIDGVEATLGVQAENLADLRGTVDGQAGAIARLDGDVAGLGGRVAANTQAILELDARIGAGGGTTLVDARVTQIDARVTQQGDTLVTLAATSAGHNTRIATLEDRADMAETRLDGHDSAIGALDGRVATIENGLGASVAALAALDTRTIANTEAIGTLQTDVARERAVNASQDATLAAHDRRIAAAQGSADEAAAAGTALRADIERGAAGLVRQQGQGAVITVASANGGDSVDFSGTAGARRLSGIAPGIASSDAATVGQVAASAADTLAAATAYTDGRIADAFGQAMGATATLLRENNRLLAADMNALAANGAALSGLPQSFLPGRGMAGASIGGHGGEVALALGVSKATESDKPTVFRAGAAVDTRRGEVTYNAGVGFHF
ncbi:YadA C-terminal domain-containing protein [Sphingomonas baiyangensis]|uniref:Trimeric autotransporter adhesin YadA-like C-terminal membrane anchor domain-containing protein n=1 Tax=Sphingomonas baiyangensis TaxID=2572576 RepID=A0A4U1L3U3_9SPHN|nr:YadA C-terminal domain-containing protein [Sphingomonas baiyangensis]TKD50796.1 hypothetical protein FBR43_08455 [Sphingomonas baiyangensis]